MSCTWSNQSLMGFVFFHEGFLAHIWETLLYIPHPDVLAVLWTHKDAAWRPVVGGWQGTGQRYSSCLRLRPGNEVTAGNAASSRHPQKLAAHACCSRGQTAKDKTERKKIKENGRKEKWSDTEMVEGRTWELKRKDRPGEHILRGESRKVNVSLRCG